MATRIKTVEYIASTVITTLPSNNLRTLTGSTSIFIPEADAGNIFTWISCTLEVVVAEDSSNVSSLTNPTIGIKIGSSNFDSVILSNPIGNSGEGEVWHLQRDVTSFFQTNWITGTTSNQWWVNLRMTGPIQANHSAKLYLTYQYDDTKITPHIKTIRIPIESTRGLLTTTYQTIGGSTAIPSDLLRTYLPEIGTIVRQSWLELWGNESTTSNGAFTMQVRIGGGEALNMWRSPSPGPSSARWAYCMCDITTYPQLSATTSLSLEGILLTTTNRMNNIGGYIGVTYEFDSTGSTSIYNSLILGGIDQTGWMGGTTLEDTDVWSRNIYIEEPDTITIKESAVMIQTQDSGGFTMTISVSGQTEQTNTFVAGTLECGIYSAVHRIDSGGRSGNGMSLQRGKNVYTLLIRSESTNAGWNVGAILILNYISGKHLNGIGAHAHSCHQLIFGNTTIGALTTNTITSSTITPVLPESYYYLIGLVLSIKYTTGAIAYGGVSISYELQPDDQYGKGWESLYVGLIRSDGENVNGWTTSAARNSFKRWNGDPDYNRSNFLTGRKYRIDMTPGSYVNFSYWYTYNSITYPISGTCLGYTGDGSGIPIDFFRIDNDVEEHILNLSTTTGGVFSGIWIDDTSTIYATARQDDAHVGRSRNGVAG